MGSMSNYLEQNLLMHLFRSGTFAKPSNVYFALASGTLDETMTGNLGGLEMPNANGYQRVGVSTSDANFAAVTQVAGSGETHNVNSITFNQATANWGTATDVAVMDSAGYGSGNMLLFGKLKNSKTIGENDQFSFAANQFEVFLD